MANSRRVDQVRRDFAGWIDYRISQLKIKRQAFIDQKNYHAAMGCALKMDELEAAKKAFLAMTR